MICSCGKGKEDDNKKKWAVLRKMITKRSGTS